MMVGTPPPEDDEREQLYERLRKGTAMLKHTKKGRGKPHRRVFWLNEDYTLSWGTSRTAKPTIACIDDITPQPSERVAKKNMPFSFTISVKIGDLVRGLDLVASNQEDFDMWTRQLKDLLISVWQP